MNKVGRPAIITKDSVKDAIRKLRAEGRDVSIPAIRSYVGEDGGNGTISKLIPVCEDELKAEESAKRSLSPKQQALADHLIRQAITQIVAEVESDAMARVRDAEAREAEEVAKAKRLGEAAWSEVDLRIRERDEARVENEQLKQSQQDALSRVARAEGTIEQQAAEIARLTSDLAKATKAHLEAGNEASALKAQLQMVREQIAEMAADLETAAQARLEASNEAAEWKGQLQALRGQLASANGGAQ